MSWSIQGQRIPSGHSVAPTAVEPCTTEAVHRAEQDAMLRTFAILMIALPFAMQAQPADDLAYLPRTAPAHTADNEGVGFSESAVAGSVDLLLPAGTHRVDLLNARGDVVQQLERDALDRLALDRLRPGTWTLRAHVGQRILVRRFQVLGAGQVAWIPDQKQVKRRPQGR